MKRRLIAIAVCAACNELAAAPTPTQGDFGGVGLLQMPTARMADEGTVSVGISRVEPYGRLAIVMQPFDWMEAVYRYTDVSTKLYSAAIAGNQSYKDKSFDVKFRLMKEDRWTPDVSVGFRDIGGTSLFSGEYLVASKRWYDLDFSLGMGWGYLGKRGDLENPLGWINDAFNTRPSSSGSQGGTVSLTSFFRGRTALFGGVQWQTPLEPLQLKLEYDGNNYRNEYGGPTVKQDSPFNFGATYRVSDTLTLQAGWERGNTLMFGLNFQGDFSPRRAPPTKTADPAPEPVRADMSRPTDTPDWGKVAQRIENSAGFQVDKIAKRDREIVVYGQQTRYSLAPTGVGRGARVLDNSSGTDIDWLTFSDSRLGMPTVETTVHRDTLRGALQEDIPLDVAQRKVEHSDPMPRREETLYQAPERDPFNWGTSIGYKQNIGGPDGFVLYQFTGNLEADYRFSPNTTLSGLLSVNLLNNYNQFRYTAPSDLPRVRTYLREYLVTSDFTMPRLQLTHAERLQPDVYGMVYAGYLESMFGGVGGEVLYRPLNSSFALGANANWVKQRDFAQDFSFRNYSVFTGHVSAYFRDLVPGTLITTSVGRYLAGDFGMTLDLAREFSNGVRMGAWATFTNVSAAKFGEGSFDKGFYLSIPFDLLTTRSTQQRANIFLQPLTRDGGARLARDKTLYDMTEGRNLDAFDRNFQQIKN